jgi:predicted RNA-binding Zn ribbon-like protein
MRINQTRDYFEIGDSDLSYAEKLARYEELSDRYFQRVEFEAFRAEALPHLREVVVEYVGSEDFDEMAVRTIREGVLEPEKHEALIERSRANTRAWCEEAGHRTRTGS